MELFDWILSLDRNLFRWVQHTGNSAFTDQAMLFLRKGSNWIPLYAFILYWLLRYARDYALMFIVMTVVAVGIADYTCSSLLKPMVGRLRPCYEMAAEDSLRLLLDGCGGKFGFPSSHASNHFALATFWYLAIRIVKDKRWTWLFAWATLICYAQVYVGKHYPLDILGGALFGSGIGIICAKIFEQWFHRKRFRNQT